MGVGTLIDDRIQLFGVPLDWRTRIDAFEPPHRFVDRQLRGPYRRWVHTHEFLETVDGTRIVDRVEYQVPFGALGWVAHALFVRPTLDRLFDFRRDRIDALFAAPSQRKFPSAQDGRSSSG